jgi:hypothetical protein
MLMFSKTAILALVHTAPTNSIHHTTTHISTTTPIHVHPPTAHTPSPSTLPYLTGIDTITDLPDSDNASHWGDSIHCSPNNFHRVYFQNLDGLHNDNEEINFYVESMFQYQVGTFCWIDPSLDFLQSAATTKIKSHTLAHFKTAYTAFSSSQIPNEGASLYKRGGTLIMTTGKWTTRCIGQPMHNR